MKNHRALPRVSIPCPPRCAKTLRRLFPAVCLLLAHPGAGAETTWTLEDHHVVSWSKPGEADTPERVETLRFLTNTLRRMTGRQLPTHPLPPAATPSPGIFLALDPPSRKVTAAKVFAGELEGYRIEAGPDVLRIEAATDAGLRNGVLDFLHAQGCRWLLPSPKWWIVPQNRKIAFTGRTASAPSFANRRIWYAYGPGGPELKSHYETWARANRLGGLASFQSGHSYGNIISRNPKAFEDHPEYFALRPVGKRSGNEHDTDPEKMTRVASPQGKFCVSNPGLRDLCLRDRLDLLQSQRARNPYAFMVSMDPSDGDGVCECPGCRALGTPTDRVLSLANHVARGLRQEIPDAWVGLYAYATHREPPTIALEPNIHVQVAMAFNRTPYSYEDLIRLWGEKAGSLGIREYYGVEAWDFGMPGKMRGAKPDYHETWIPRYHRAGAVSVNAECNANWGAQALGLYTAARLLWQVDAEVEAIRRDFLDSAFGPAAPWMDRLYAHFADTPRMSPGNLSAMYDLAFEALEASVAEDIRARVTDLVAYLNYAVLYSRFARTEGHSESYYEALDTLMTYAHRIESRNMVHTYALARRLCNANVKGRRNEFWLFGDDVIWKRGAPFEDAEILAMANDFRAELGRALTLRKTFTDDLVPVDNPPGPRRGHHRLVRFRHRATAFLRPRRAGRASLEMSDRVVAALEKMNGESVPLVIQPGPDDAVTASAGMLADTLYRLTLSAGGSTVQVRFPEELDVALEASEDAPLWLDMGGPFYLLVPPGTDALRCLGSPRLSLLTPDGTREDISSARYGENGFATLPATYETPLWTVWNQTRGAIAFLNVPPLVQLDPDRVLLPREIAPTLAPQPGEETE